MAGYPVPCNQPRMEYPPAIMVALCRRNASSSAPSARPVYPSTSITGVVRGNCSLTWSCLAVTSPHFVALPNSESWKSRESVHAADHKEFVPVPRMSTVQSHDLFEM
jgi:hypothetical protein